MDIFDEVLDSLPDFPVTDLRVGLHWTAAVSKNCGLALTLPEPYKMGVRNAGSIVGRSGKEVAGFARSWNPVEASIGVATLNSLLDFDGEEINAIDYIERISKNKKIVFIGHFPGLERIKEKASSMIVLERSPHKGDLPDTACEYVIPDADIVAISGSVFVNRTFKRLLELSENVYTILLGPSVIKSDILFNYGVDAIASSNVINSSTVLNAVSEGGHLDDFSRYLKYVMKFKR